jgi:hypothetical protein
VIPGYCPIISETDPLGFLVQPTADRDVEVTDLPVVEDVAHRWLVEAVLVVQDLLLEGVDAIFVPFCRDGGVGLLVCDGLEEPIGNSLE